MNLLRAIQTLKKRKISILYFQVQINKFISLFLVQSKAIRSHVQVYSLAEGLQQAGGVRGQETLLPQ